MRHSDKGSKLLALEKNSLSYSYNILILCYFAVKDDSVVFPLLKSLSFLYGEAHYTNMSHLKNSISNL